jgi:SAM-dependent methyltransferase
LKQREEEEMSNLAMQKGYFICPACHSALDDDLSCANCNFKGFVRNNLIYLHLDDNTWIKCEKEKAGWIGIQKEQGIYLDNQDHYYLPDGKPHLKEFYKEAKRSIDKLLDLVDFNGKICLDIGAGIGWVECYILKQIRTVQIIALECNDDDFIGLGRSGALKKYHHCDFYSLVADMHNIPISDNSMDIVFMVDALHHFSDMYEVFGQVHRVLKHGGHFYAINEPFRPDDVVDETLFVSRDCPSEFKHGINERRPTKKEYLEAGQVIDLQILNEKINFVAPGLILYGKK